MNSEYTSGPWLVVVAALMWALDAPFRKYLTGDLSSTTIVLMEHITIAILVLVFFARYLKELRELEWKEWLAVIFIGWGGSALATVLFTQSFHYVNPSVSILLQKVQPIIAILLAGAILKERLTKNFWMWASIGIFGAYLISFPEIRISGLSFTGGSRGILFALLAAFFWGGSTVFGRYLLRKLSFQAMTAARFLSALIFLFFLEIYFGATHEIALASTKDWLFVFIIAIIAGFVALFIYYRGLQHTKASIATICELAFPFSAVIVNWIFLGATLSFVQIIGGLILLFSMVMLSFVNAEETTGEVMVQNT